MRDWFSIIDYVTSGMLIRNKDWRAGQGLFNAIALVRPDLAEEIRGQNLDPFYNNGRIPTTVAWLKLRLSREAVEESLTEVIKEEGKDK